MNVLGIDPSSSSTGAAFLTDGEIHSVYRWEPLKDKSLGEDFLSYANWINKIILSNKPDVVVVESPHSKILNVKTFKKIAYFEALSIFAAAVNLRGAHIIHLSAKEARKYAFGNGGLTKEEVWEKGNYVYDWWNPSTMGGQDQTDAWCLALAGHNLVKNN